MATSCAPLLSTPSYAYALAPNVAVKFIDLPGQSCS